MNLKEKLNKLGVMSRNYMGHSQLSTNNEIANLILIIGTSSIAYIHGIFLVLMHIHNQFCAQIIWRKGLHIVFFILKQKIQIQAKDSYWAAHCLYNLPNQNIENRF